jgi:hypothetical protein
VSRVRPDGHFQAWRESQKGIPKGTESKCGHTPSSARRSVVWAAVDTYCDVGGAFLESGRIHQNRQGHGRIEDGSGGNPSEYTESSDATNGAPGLHGLLLLMG